MPHILYKKPLKRAIIMCGNNRSVPDGKREDFQENHTQDTREYFPVHEYRVPCLEEAYRDDITRGSAYLEIGTGHF